MRAFALVLRGLRQHPSVRYVGYGSLATLAALLTSATSSRRVARFDLLIRHARIVDGTGNPWFRGDVAVSGDRIMPQLARSIAADATRVIDAADRVLAPGLSI